MKTSGLSWHPCPASLVHYEMFKCQFYQHTLCSKMTFHMLPYNTTQPFDWKYHQNALDTRMNCQTVWFFWGEKKKKSWFSLLICHHMCSYLQWLEVRRLGLHFISSYLRIQIYSWLCLMPSKCEGGGGFFENQQVGMGHQSKGSEVRMDRDNCFDDYTNAFSVLTLICW